MARRPSIDTSSVRSGCGLRDVDVRVAVVAEDPEVARRGAGRPTTAGGSRVVGIDADAAGLHRGADVAVGQDGHRAPDQSAMARRDALSARYDACRLRRRRARSSSDVCPGRPRLRARRTACRPRASAARGPRSSGRRWRIGCRRSGRARAAGPWPSRRSFATEPRLRRGRGGRPRSRRRPCRRHPQEPVGASAPCARPVASLSRSNSSRLPSALDDRQARRLDALVRREARRAQVALAPTTDGGIVEVARVDDARVTFPAVRAAHLRHPSLHH